MTILYSTGCPKCNVLKMKLQLAGVEFEECNDVGEMQRLGMMEAPLLSVNGKEMGFVDAVSWINNLEVGVDGNNN